MNFYRQFLLLLAFTTPLFASPWPVDEKKIEFPYEQPPKTKPEPSFPDKFTNVALNKKVVVGPASVRHSYSLPIIGDLTSVTDGKIDNRTKQGGTYDEGMYASMADVPHYIQIDLEENFKGKLCGSGIVILLNAGMSPME